MNNQGNTQQRNTIDVLRTHTVGRFLNENPEAKKVVTANRRHSKKLYTLSEDNKSEFNGGVRRGSMLGKGEGFDISIKARNV